MMSWSDLVCRKAIISEVYQHWSMIPQLVLEDTVGFKFMRHPGKSERKDNMMNFYETQMGKRFFESQLPRLIKALENISEALSRKTEPLPLPVETPDDFLEEFYYGNLEIGTSSMEGYSHHNAKEIISIQDELQAQLTPEQWALFQKCTTLMGNRSLEEVSRMFQHGYRMAVRLIVAGLQEPKKEEKQDGKTI